MHEPFRTMYLCLMDKSFPVGKWHYSVKISSSQDAIYIGNDKFHYTVLSGVNGFHHTVNGVNRGQVDATTFTELIKKCRWDCTAEMLAALNWFQNKCTAYYQA